MPDEETLSPRMRQLRAAALVVVSDAGLRGLTHRAVDRQAGLPEGSCSAYLRTRHALTTALGEYVAGHLAADVHHLTEALADCPGDHARATTEIAALFERWLHGRELVTRFEVSLEAIRDPGLAERFQSWRDDLVGVVANALTMDGGAADVVRAEALVVSLDGVLLGALLRPESERGDYLSRCVALLIDGLSPQP